jgi:hypothetical protein
MLNWFRPIHHPCIRAGSVAALIATGAVISAQTYTVQKTSVLAGTTEAITIQQPASGAKNVDLLSAYVDCMNNGASVDTTVTLERNGTAATTTTLATAQVNPQVAVASTVQAFSASNVGAGTVLHVSEFLGFQVFELSSLIMRGNGGSQNFTIRIAAITATCHITIKWTERTVSP